MLKYVPRSNGKHVGDIYTSKFFNVVRQNIASFLTKLKDHRGQFFTMREVIDHISRNFYKELYKHKDISEDALREVFDDLPIAFLDVMDDSFAKEITQHELYEVVDSMANGKAPWHDGILIKLIK